MMLLTGGLVRHAQERNLPLANVYTYCTVGIMLKRTTVFLADDQIKRLAKVSKCKGINTAQLIRIYINAGLDKDKS